MWWGIVEWCRLSGWEGLIAAWRNSKLLVLHGMIDNSWAQFYLLPEHNQLLYHFLLLFDLLVFQALFLLLYTLDLDAFIKGAIHLGNDIRGLL